MKKRHLLLAMVLGVLLASRIFLIESGKITRAANERIDCFLEKTSATFSSNGEVEVNVFCNSDESIKVLGITSAINYNSTLLEVVDKGGSYANDNCKNNNFQHSNLLFANTSTANLLKMARVAQGAPNTLPSGLFCAQTVVFRIRGFTAPQKLPSSCTKDLDCIYVDNSQKQIFGKCVNNSCNFTITPTPAAPLAVEFSLAARENWQIVSANTGALDTVVDSSRKMLVSNSSSQISSTPSKSSESEQIRCENTAGRWKAMPDNCSFRCPTSRNDIVCQAGIVEGCLCGVGKCFDGNRCVSTTDSLTLAPTSGAAPTQGPSEAKAPSFKIESYSINNAGNLQFDVVIDSLQNLISGFDALFSFDSTQLAIVSIEPSAYMQSTAKKKTNEGLISGVVSSESLRSGRGIVAKVIMKKITSSDAIIRFVCREGASNDSNILDGKDFVKDIINCNHNDKLTWTGNGSVVVERDNNSAAGGQCQAKVVYVVPNRDGYKSISGLCPIGTYSRADFVCTRNVPQGSNTLGDGTKCQQLADYKDAAEKICNSINSCVENPTPPGNCQKHSNGDINCNNKCDLNDFELFRRAYVKRPTTEPQSVKPDDRGSEIFTTATVNNPDVNGDGKVTLKDFNLWRQCYFEGKKTLSAQQRVVLTSVSGLLGTDGEDLILTLSDPISIEKVKQCGYGNKLKITNPLKVDKSLVGKSVLSDLACQKQEGEFVPASDQNGVEIINLTSE